MSRTNRTELLPWTTGSSSALKRAKPGRVCEAEGCQTVLSIYNDSSDCSMHARWTTKLVRRRV